MKDYFKPFRCSIYLMVLLTVSGCSNELLLSSTVNSMQSFALRLIDPIFRINVKTSSELQSTATQKNTLATAAILAPTKPNYTFALQLASVSSETAIEVTFHKMAKQAPSIFQGKPILNVEVADVHDRTFYRLKFGGYKYLKNAKADCEAIKRQGIDCWVSNYTDNRIYF